MRKDRVASLLEREIANIITQDMNDPRCQFITVTRVVVSSDLKEADVYFSSLSNKSESLATLQKAKGYIKSMLAHRVRLKFLPELNFIIDNSYEYTRKIDELIEKIGNGDTQ
jgi:ribosome-binding factor A